MPQGPSGAGGQSHHIPEGMQSLHPGTEAYTNFVKESEINQEETPPADQRLTLSQNKTDPQEGAGEKLKPFNAHRGARQYDAGELSQALKEQQTEATNPSPKTENKRATQYDLMPALPKTPASETPAKNETQNLEQQTEATNPSPKTENKRATQYDLMPVLPKTPASTSGETSLPSGPPRKTGHHSYADTLGKNPATPQKQSNPHTTRGAKRPPIPTTPPPPVPTEKSTDSKPSNTAATEEYIKNLNPKGSIANKSKEVDIFQGIDDGDEKGPTASTTDHTAKKTNAFTLESLYDDPDTAPSETVKNKESQQPQSTKVSQLKDDEPEGITSERTLTPKKKESTSTAKTEQKKKPNKQEREALNILGHISKKSPKKLTPEDMQTVHAQKGKLPGNIVQDMLATFANPNNETIPEATRTKASMLLGKP